MHRTEGSEGNKTKAETRKGRKEAKPTLLTKMRDMYHIRVIKRGARWGRKKAPKITFRRRRRRFGKVRPGDHRMESQMQMVLVCSRARSRMQTNVEMGIIYELAGPDEPFP